MLSDAQLTQYSEDGYTVAHEFFSDLEVAAIQAEVERLKTEGRNVATLADGETPSGAAANLQIIPLGPKSELLRTLPFSEKVRTVITQLIGDDALLQLDQVFVKPPRHGAGTSWHQDNAYFGIPDPTQGVGMWVAVHDANVANGTMHVVPRSHREALTHTRDMGSDHHICCQIDETVHEVVPVEMKAGGALFFNYGVAHCTLANNTGNERAGMALHFLKGAYRDQVKIGLESLRPVIAGPNYSKGVEEWGADLEGAWERKCALA